MNLFTFIPDLDNVADVQAQRLLKDDGYYAGKLDGDFGPKSRAALAKWDADNGVHRVLASSFADPADVKAYLRAKAAGVSENAAKKVGDNGVGKWNDSTVLGSGASCALPPEDWRGLKAPRGTKVEVFANRRTAIVLLKDTMPARKNIKNGCGIDLNPDACALLGLHPPMKIPAAWRWA